MGVQAVPTDGSTHCGRCPHGGATRNRDRDLDLS
jgi:hypothetical protein